VDLEVSDLEAPKHGHRAAAGERKEGDDEIRASAGERDPVVEILWFDCRRRRTRASGPYRNRAPASQNSQPFHLSQMNSAPINMATKAIAAAVDDFCSKRKRYRSASILMSSSKSPDIHRSPGLPGSAYNRAYPALTATQLLLPGYRYICAATWDSTSTPKDYQSIASSLIEAGKENPLANPRPPLWPVLSAVHASSTRSANAAS